MRPVLCLLIAAVSLLACAVAPSESMTSAEVVGVNRVAANRVAANRVAANRVAANRVAANRVAVNREAVGDLLNTDDGRAVFSLMVSCALPDTITLVATVDGTDFEFSGELGLAPQWIYVRLDHDGQRWVSACMFARVNAHELAVPISMRGPDRELATDADERATWTLEEGAFFGNLFGPTNQPIQWFACRGKDQAAGETGGLVDRDCAEPDPQNPGYTLCGFVFAGDCGSFAADRACESFSTAGTFYRECRTSPIRHHHHDCGRRDTERDRDRDDDDGDDVFTQVITTFVTP
jgi:hypothetical protein